MKKIFQLFKEKRKGLGVGIERAARKTGIPRRYLLAIESGRCTKIPAGYLNIYIRNYAQFLKIDQKRALALFRRDCNIGSPIRRRIVNDNRHRWRPSLPFASRLNTQDLLSLLGLGSWQVLVFAWIIVLAFSYLGFQYYRFNQSPRVELSSSFQDTFKERFLVVGKTGPDTVLKINDRVVFVDQDGSFKGEVILLEGENVVVVEAESPSGKKTTIEKKVVFHKNSI